jgi:hypothetical protein
MTSKTMMQTSYVLEHRKDNKFKEMKKWMNKRKEVGNGIVNELTQFSSYISSNARFSKSSTHFTQIGTGGSPS